jgi:adenylate kinase
VSNPPRRAGFCDRDNTPLVQREDDKPETLRERLRVYHTNMVHLLPHYRAQGLIREISGQGSIDEVFAQIMRVLSPQAGPSC